MVMGFDVRALSVFEKVSNGSVAEKQAWDNRHAEITVDGKQVTIEALSRVTKASSITVNGAYFSDVKLADDLKAEHVMFYRCGGNILLGKNTSVGFLTIESCSGIRALPEALTCEHAIVVNDCAAFEKIGSGLIINRMGEWNGNGCIGLRVSDCPKFEMMEGAATVNGFLSFLNVPSFKGLSPMIKQDERYSCMTDKFQSRQHEREESVPARAELRALWEINKPKRAPGVHFS